MNHSLMKSQANLINQIHDRIAANMKTALEDATECGKLLCEVKEQIGHGNFIQWIKDNLVVSERSARRYMDLFIYRNKTASVADLQEAYKQIEHIKTRENEEQRKHDDELIRKRIKTGEKPEGWNQSLEYQYKKRTDDEAFNERLKNEFKKGGKEKSEPYVDSGKTEKIIGEILKSSTEKNAAREKLKLNVREDNTGQEAMFDIINGYLNSFADTSRKIEAAQNIIKYLRSIIINYQKVKA